MNRSFLPLSFLLFLLLPFCSGCRLWRSEAHVGREDLASLQVVASRCAYCRTYCQQASIRAEREGLFDAARLFAALASSQQVHELLYVSAIHHLGGTYRPPRHLILRLSSTSENLRHFLVEENYAEQIPIARFLERQNRYVARLMVRHAASENRARRLIDLLLLHPEADRSRHYQVCPRCGYLCSDRHPDLYCPQCMAPARRFHRF